MPRGSGGSTPGKVIFGWADGLDIKAGLACRPRQRSSSDRGAHEWPQGRAPDGERPAQVEGISKESWGAVLRDRRSRELKPWRCPLADGHVGSWAALVEQPPMAAEQRGWPHRLVKGLAAIPTPPGRGDDAVDPLALG